MKGAGFCSLYREIHYYEIHYNEIWVYFIWVNVLELHAPMPMGLYIPGSLTVIGGIGLSWFRYRHSNYSYQCTILAADFVIFHYGIENDQAIQAGAGSE